MGSHIVDNTKERSVPVVLMVGRGMADERTAIVRWLETSRFSACDAADMFEVMGELADFTVRERPDVIVLDIDPCTENVALIRSMFPSDKNDSVPLFMTLSRPDCFESYLTAVAARLDALIPHHLDH